MRTAVVIFAVLEAPFLADRPSPLGDGPGARYPSADSRREHKGRAPLVHVAPVDLSDGEPRITSLQARERRFTPGHPVDTTGQNWCMCTPNGTSGQMISEAGYGSEEPLVVGLHGQGHGPVFVAQGVTHTGEPVSSATVTYAASLSNRSWLCAAALLVREGVLEVEAPLAKWLPELPAWAASVQVCHLLCHIAALPDQQVEAFLGPTADRTTPAVLAALTEIPALAGRPGLTYAYWGPGTSARRGGGAGSRGAVACVCREPVRPLAMNSTSYWPGARAGATGRRAGGRARPCSAVAGRRRGLVDGRRPYYGAGTQRR